MREYWVKVNEFSMVRITAPNKRDAIIRAWNLVKQGLQKGWPTWNEFRSKATVTEIPATRMETIEIGD